MRKKIGLASICLGLVAIAIGLCLFFFGGNKDKIIFKDAISASANNIKALFNSDNKKENTEWPVELKSKIIKLTTTNNIILDDGEIIFNGDIFGNEKNDLIMDFLVDSGIDKYTYQIVEKDNVIYFTIVDLLEKYYSIEDNSSDDNNSSIMFNKLIDYMSDSIINNIGNDIDKEDTTLTINSKKYDVKKYSCYFSSKDIINILIDFFDKINNDEEFEEYVDLLENYNISIDTLIKELRDSSKELVDEDTILKYSIYKNGDDVVSNTLVVTIADFPVSISCINVDDYFMLKVSSLGNDIASFECVKKSNTLTEFNINIIDTVVINGTSAINAEEGIANINFIGVDNDGNEILNFELSLVMSEENENGEINIKLNVSGENIFSGNTMINFVDSMPEIDVSNSVPIADMTENDKNILSSLFGSSEVLVPNDTEV